MAFTVKVKFDANNFLAGVDAITVSARPEWTRRVIDPWIIRCRLALWYFSVLVFFGSAIAIVVMIVTTHFL